MIPWASQHCVRAQFWYGTGGEKIFTQDEGVHNYCHMRMHAYASRTRGGKQGGGTHKLHLSDVSWGLGLALRSRSGLWSPPSVLMISGPGKKGTIWVKILAPNPKSPPFPLGHYIGILTENGGENSSFKRQTQKVDILKGGSG